MEQRTGQAAVTDKTITFAAVLLLAAVIGIMSWRDMHPQKELAGQASENIPTGYFVDSSITPGLIPDDNLPLSIAQGRFKYKPNGKMEFTPQGVPPTLFAQRQITLLLQFDALPKNREETFKKILSLIADWKHQGNIVNGVIFDYRPRRPAAQPDFPAYAEFLAAFRKFSLPDAYLLIPMIDFSWSKNLALLSQDGIPFFLADLPPANIPVPAFNHKFQLRVPAGVSLPSIENHLFVGSLTTLDPHSAPPLAKEKLGLFPAFLNR